MTVTRRLTDLFVVGRTLELDDGRGEPVVVWLQKLSPLEHSDAVRMGDAERAKVLAQQHNPRDPDMIALRESVPEMGTRDELVAFATSEERSRVESVEEARLGAEEEWSKDSYLQGLKDAWEGGLKDSYALDPEHVEAKRVFDEMKRFTDELASRVADQMDALVDSYSGIPDSELYDQVVERMLKGTATQVWLARFQAAQLWYGVRPHDPDIPEDAPHPEHNGRYFTNIEELSELQGETVTRLRNAWSALEVGVVEGKDSPQVPSSSPSSEPPSEVATVDSSGPLVSVP